MSYLKQTLTSDEQVLTQCKPHWIIYSRSVMWIVLTLICFFILPKFNWFDFVIFKSFNLYMLLALVALAMAIFSAIAGYFVYETSEYAITTRRVLMKRGLLRRITLEIFIPRIESIKIHQTILGRICNYGTLVISGVGGSKDPFPTVPDPIKFQRIIQQQIAQFNRSGSAEISEKA